MGSNPISRPPAPLTPVHGAFLCWSAVAQAVRGESLDFLGLTDGPAKVFGDFGDFGDFGVFRVFRVCRLSRRRSEASLSASWGLTDGPAKASPRRRTSVERPLIRALSSQAC